MLTPVLVISRPPYDVNEGLEDDSAEALDDFDNAGNENWKKGKRYNLKFLVILFDKRKGAETYSFSENR